MHYMILSFSHKSNLINIREKLSFNTDNEKENILKNILANKFIDEVVLLNTCNRVEIFFSSFNLDVLSYIYEILSKHSEIDIEELRKRADVFEDKAAIHHLFSVVSSLDSLVIGETQIIKQFKDAFTFSINRKYCAKKLLRAMDYALKCSSSVRKNTKISQKNLSIASLTVSKASKLLEDMKDKRVLVIGCGEMSRLCIKYLIPYNVKLFLVNRTKKRAEDLLKEFKYDISILDFANIDKFINDFDLVFSATSSKEPIIRDNFVKDRIYNRYWFDMAIPRDINIKNLKKGLFLSSLDDLEAIVKKNVVFKEKEAKSSYKIISKYTLSFYDEISKFSLEPLIKDIRLKAKKAVDDELKRVLARKFIPVKYKYELNKMAEQTMNRFLHNLTFNLRNMKDEDNIYKSKNVIKELFFDKNISCDKEGQ